MTSSTKPQAAIRGESSQDHSQHA